MATNSVRRTAIKTMLGGLSVLTGYGAFYQFTKYAQTSNKWTKIEKVIQDFEPIEIKGSDAKTYPWLERGKLKDWEYKVIKIKGWFKEERFFVKRQRDGKDGYLVFGVFTTATEALESDEKSASNTPRDTQLFVNLGWVPEENRDDIEMTGEPVPLVDNIEDETDAEYDFNTGFSNDAEPLNEDDALQLTEITALVRRGEEENILQGRRNWNNQAVFQYVDLDYMARFFRLSSLDAARTAYLERIVPSYEEDEEELYPVPASKNNFEKPIVTPQKHLENFYFLGGTSAVSIISLLTFLKR